MIGLSKLPQPSEEKVADMDTESMPDTKTKAKKNNKDSDGLTTPKTSKRSRVTSPKNNSEIEISNSVSLLEETPLL